MAWCGNPLLTQIWHHALSPRRLSRSQIVQALVMLAMASLCLEMVTQTAGIPVAAAVIDYFPLWVGPLISVWIVMNLTSAMSRLKEQGFLAQILVTPIPGGKVVWALVLPTTVLHLIIWTALNLIVRLFAHRLSRLGHYWDHGLIYPLLTYTLVACAAHIPLCVAVSLRLALSSRGLLWPSAAGSLGLSVLYVIMWIAVLLMGISTAYFGVFFFPTAWLVASWGISWILVSDMARHFHVICRLEVE